MEQSRFIITIFTYTCERASIHASMGILQLHISENETESKRFHLSSFPHCIESGLLGLEEQLPDRKPCRLRRPLTPYMYSIIYIGVSRLVDKS